MTTLTLASQPAKQTALRPVPWRNMLWVTWRLNRATLISVPAVLAAVALFLWIAGLGVHHDYAVLTACQHRCLALNNSFNGTDWTIGNTVDILLNLAPALIGAFAGCSLLARELETGTYRYAWTQGFGRTRWTVAKLTVVAVTITIAAWAFSEVFTWFFKPFLAQEDLTVLNATVFATHGIAFAAWTLLAFSVGALAGMFLRRTVPAMAVTLGVYLGLAILTWTVLRKHYLPPIVTSGVVPFTGSSNPNMPWILGNWVSGRTSYVSYIPVSRFWPMQLIEGGWLLALSILFMAASVWLVRRRAA
jgi:hypothetical protein